MPTNPNNLFNQAHHCLMLTEPEQKVVCATRFYQSVLNNEFDTETTGQVDTIEIPGRPSKPDLVDPRDVAKRSFTTEHGKLALVHAIAHIEFNAINLALDAVYRFQSMPQQYYIDWARVAAEEALHFNLLSGYLKDRGMSYGDEPAHNGLWEMAIKTDEDVLVRMALVPRVLEARGLDVTPTMINKLQAAGDMELKKILERIFEDEIGHVKIGTHWFNTLCEQRELAPGDTFIDLVQQYMAGAKFGPFEFEARKQAGFTEEELQSLLNCF